MQKGKTRDAIYWRPDLETGAEFKRTARKFGMSAGRLMDVLARAALGLPSPTDEAARIVLRRVEELRKAA